MKIVEMVYEVTETCQNGKERTFKKKVYADHMFEWEKGAEALRKRGYYKILFLSADWKDVIVV